MAEARTYRPDIDGLRAVAVLAVILYHAFPHTLRGGFIGVDIFFVISGYLITQQLLQPGCSIKQFYIRRIRRLFPALLVVMAATFAFGWFTLFASEFSALGKHMAGGAGFIANLLYWGESGYFDAASTTKPLRHLWSLGIEEQFYLIWPVLILLWVRSKRKPDLLVFGLLIASFTANYLLRHHLAMDFYAPFTRFWELLLGAVLVLATPQQNSLANNFISIVGMLLCIGGLVIITDANSYPGILGILPTIGAALLIAGGVASVVNRALSIRPLVAIGRISYPLYLWHWPLFAFASIIAADDLSLATRIALLAASFALAGATYHWVEKPLRFKGEAIQRARILLAAMLVLGLMGGAVYLGHGLPFRAIDRTYADNAKELVRPPYTDQACLDMMGWQDEQVNYCRFHDVGGKETIVVIGDSFAHAAFEGMAKFLAPRGINTLMLGNAGCPAIGSDHAIPSCGKQADAMLQGLLSRKDVKRVFITSRASGYLLEQNRWEIGKPSAAAREWRAGMQATIDRLNAAGMKPYTIIENTTTGILAAKCIERPLRHGVNPCILPRNEVEARERPYRWLVGQLKHTTVIDTMDAFCPEDTCRMIQDGILLYADDGHLSVSGSYFQAERILAPYLPKKP